MKTFILLASLMFTCAFLQAQNYHISFTGSGESSTVNIVQVLNLTQGTSLSLSGSDSLNLVGTIGINSLTNSENYFNIYPNPMNETSNIEFYNSKSGQVSVEIFDVTGKVITSLNKQIQNGNQTFEISGLNAGVYIVNVSTTKLRYAGNLISNSWDSGNPTIKYLGGDYLSKTKHPLKSIKSIVQMQYNNGERLLFKGVSGNYSRVLTLVPTNSQIVNFEFVTCTDLDSNHYAVVTIGTQTWMAENLAYLPSVSPASSGSSSASYYYVYEYQGTSVTAAKATTNYLTYGVLYNWPAAMNGSPSSNSVPSGVQGVCPTGWHLPSDNEWDIIVNYLGGDSIAGSKMKETGTTHWMGSNIGSTNSSGFTGLPGGGRYLDGNFHNIGGWGFWWNSTEYDTSNARYRKMDYYYGFVYSDTHYKRTGFAVRCLRD